MTYVETLKKLTKEQQEEVSARRVILLAAPETDLLVNTSWEREGAAPRTVLARGRNAHNGDSFGIVFLSDGTIWDYQSFFLANQRVPDNE